MLRMEIALFLVLALVAYVHYPKLEGNSVSILNVQKRIKLFCGREYGLRYTENTTGGVTARLLLPRTEERVE